MFDWLNIFHSQCNECDCFWLKSPKQIHTKVTWLILPVVICLFQRLSHACLSINIFIPWNCVQLIISVILSLMVFYYMDNRSNSRANTCHKISTREGRDGFIRYRTNGIAIYLLVIHDNFTERMTLCWRQFIQVPALSAFVCKVLAYIGIDGWRRIRVRFRRGSLRDCYHIQGRQQARKLPNPNTGR